METIQFLDPETGEEIRFAVEAETMLNGNKYLLVSAADEAGEENAYLLKQTGAKGDELIYQLVEDDVEFAAIARVFSEQLDEELALEYE